MSGLAARALVVGRDSFRAGPISFEGPPGAFVAIIGPNGGGKTTLLRTLAGLLPPLAGEVDAPPGAAYLPPPSAIVASLPTGHVVALGRAPRRGWSPMLAAGDYAAARSALEALGIGDLAARPFDRLSSGQQQLALVARLVVQDARVCLLDEPTAMLDLPHAAAVERALRKLAGEGRTVVASTHHLNLARQADLVISVGVAIRADLPDEALSSPALSALYGAQIDLCPCCGQPFKGSISA